MKPKPKTKPVTISVKELVKTALFEAITDIEAYCSDWNSDHPTDPTVCLAALKEATALWELLESKNPEEAGILLTGEAGILLKWGGKDEA